MMSLPYERIIFVPACLLCPLYMAENKKPNCAWQREIIYYLIENSYSIISFPCPESSFSHPKAGIHRQPHGIQFYEKLDGFHEYCYELSRKVIDQIVELTSKGYNVYAILGIEHSPTCAVNYMYTHRGMIKRAGVFVENLSLGLCKRDLDIPIIGINRRFPNKAIDSIENL